MGIPRKLKNMNIHVDGQGYLGVASEYEEPVLAIATEEHRGGGMIGSVKIDLGVEPMEATLKMGGHEARLIRKFGTTRVDGVRVRLTGAYQADDGTPAQAVEVFIGGRFTEITPGTSKAGDDTEQEFKVAVAYYRRVVDGVPQVEIDMVAGRFIVGGIDRYAEIMAIIAN
ncbi:MAG: phage major tail tube protein [Sphingomonadales bacterium]|nr:phage major tail tube protein [Sphingomonadales bacterium]